MEEFTYREEDSSLLTIIWHHTTWYTEELLFNLHWDLYNNLWPELLYYVKQILSDSTWRILLLLAFLESKGLCVSLSPRDSCKYSANRINRLNRSFLTFHTIKLYLYCLGPQHVPDFSKLPISMHYCVC